MKRLGLVGVGAWGRKCKDRIGARSDCRIAAFTRRSSASGVEIASARACASWQELVACAKAGELDGVIVATTPENQVEIALACAEAGVPLLVENPLGLSMAEAENVRAAFHRSAHKAPLLVDYIHLWSPAYRELKRLVRESTSGWISIETQGFNRGPLRSFSSLYDYGPHDVSMVIELLGENAPWRLLDARCAKTSEGFELYEADFDIGGVAAHLAVGNGGPRKARRFTIADRIGRTLVYDDTLPHPTKLTDDGEPVAIGEEGPLDNVLGAFVEQIDRWREGRLTAEDAERSLSISVRVNAMLDAIASACGHRDHR